MTKAINKRRAPDKNTEIVFEYLEKFPEAPSKTLARKIHAENSVFFDSFESVYLKVRYYRGQTGKQKRHYMSQGSNNKFIKELKTKVMHNNLTLPDIQKHETNLLFLQDV
jgi:hypothetical protein